MYTNIQQAIAAVESAYPSIYSKEDVITLLNQIEIEQSTTVGLDADAISSLAGTIADEIENEGTNIIDDYDLSMNYKEVELDSVDFNTRAIKSAVEQTIKNFIDDLNDHE